MYCATPDGSGCACGFGCEGAGFHEHPETLGNYGFPGGGGAFDWSGGPTLPPLGFNPGTFGYPGAGPFDFTPTGTTTLGLNVPDWLGNAWDTIKGELGEAAGELGGEVVEWIQRRIGQEAWERMPDSSRREVTRQAVTELTGGLGAPNVLPWVIAAVAGGLLLARRR